jgi:hypothetical protein
MKLPVDSQGRVYSIDGPPAAGAVFNGGLAFTPQGQVYSANQQASDVFVGGWRVSVLGELVETDSTPAQRSGQVFVAGIPVGNSGTPSRPGAVLRQVNQTPAPTDPYVARVRVGPLGGMYQTTAGTPTPPVNTVAPVVTGVPQSSNTLTCSTGTWTGAQEIVFQWLNSGTPMIGQNSSTFTVNSTYIGSVISCAVTASNEYGSNTAVSNAVTIIP